jgi:excisionase family DNA binding protein
VPVDRYVRIGDAAQQLGVSVDTMRRWAEEGIIAGYRSPGGQVKFLQRDVRDLLTRSDEPRPSRRVADVARANLTGVSPDETKPLPAARWKDLPPWEQRRAEVETDLAIERLTAEREQERADVDRMEQEERARASEVARLVELKRLGRISVTTSEATDEAIRELERYVTSEQIPAWLSKWEQVRMVQTFVWGICDRVWKQRLEAIRKA